MLDLSEKSYKELNKLADSIGIKASDGETAESLRLRIATVIYPPEEPRVEVQSPRPAPVPESCTQEEVLALAEKYKVSVRFPDETTWHFRKGVAEDSGTLKQSLKVIERKADIISKARQPAFHSADAGFDPGNKVLGA
jgi:hypothetical protein